MGQHGVLSHLDSQGHPCFHKRGFTSAVRLGRLPAPRAVSWSLCRSWQYLTRSTPLAQAWQWSRTSTREPVARRGPDKGSLRHHHVPVRARHAMHCAEAQTAQRCTDGRSPSVSADQDERSARPASCPAAQRRKRLQPGCLRCHGPGPRTGISSDCSELDWQHQQHAAVNHRRSEPVATLEAVRPWPLSGTPRLGACDATALATRSTDYYGYCR